MRLLRHAWLLLLPALLSAQEGREFLLAWPPTYYDSAELLLATASPSPVAVRIEGPELSVEAFPAAGAPARVPLPAGVRVEAFGRSRGAAIRLSAAAPIGVVLHAPATEGIPDSLVWTSHDAVRIPPLSALGDAYRALSWPNDWGCGPDACESSSFLLAVATAPGTRLRVGASPCSGPQEIDLEAGDAFLLRCDGPGEDVTGTAASADLPFLLLSGNRGVLVPGEGGSADTLLSAPLPESAWGTLHHVLSVPRDPFFETEGDRIRVVGGEVGGEVRIVSPSRSEVRSLPPGGIVEIDGGEWDGEPLRIESERPVSVAQLPKSRDHRGLGDPSLLALTPSDGGAREARLLLPDGYGDGYHLGVVAPAGSGVRLDGLPIALEPLPGASHAGAVVTLPAPAPGEAGEHVLVADRPVAAWVSGQGLYKSFLYAAGRRVPPTVRRGDDPEGLAILAREAESPWEDGEALDGAPPLLYYRVDAAEALHLRREGGSIVLEF